MAEAIKTGRVGWCASLMALLISFSAATVATAQETPKQEALRLQKEAQTILDGGRYQDGIGLAKRALAIQERALGNEHPDVAASLQILGRLHEKVGNYDLARSAHQRALDLREKLLGSEHRDTAASLADLADAYGVSKNYSIAEPLYQRALSIFEKAAGTEHIDTSRPLIALANIYEKRDAAFDRAESLLKRALAIRERVSGAESHDTAQVLNNLGALYYGMGAYGQAKTMYQRALAIFEKVRGPEHPETTFVLANLASLHSEVGDYTEAEAIYVIDESGAYLGERFNVSYLTSGRDLLRIATEPTPSADTVVVGDPDYGRRAALPLGNTPSIQPQRSADLDRGGLLFRPLAGTALEAQDLKALLQLNDVNLLLRRDASEGNLKRLKAPRILHIASHGFFLSDQQLAGEISKRRSSGSATLASIENPLLRSGIALAGANERNSGEDDGILTALEATQLDLSRTALVVLSACDSGVGEVQNGEGVYGLRRALALAGAQTQVTSLWKVPDEATRTLMVDCYRRLLQGEGRSSAMRSTQLAMLANPARAHPYYWASFIPIGNWSPLPLHPGGRRAR